MLADQENPEFPVDQNDPQYPTNAGDANANADTSYDSALFEDTRDHFSGVEEAAADNPDPEELNPELVDPPAEPPALDAPVDPDAALRQAIVDAFGQAGRNASYPMPTFSGKKGEKPDNHILWFTDYCNHYKIVLAQKSNEFVKTLTGKAQAWANAVPCVGAPPHLPLFERAADMGPDPEEERQTLRHQFITRFAP